MVAAVLVALWVLALGDGGFVTAPAGVQWEWGVPTSGPGGTDAMWATKLGGNYLNDATDSLEVPVPDLTGVADPVLVIEHWYEIQAGDGAWFEVDDGSGWAPVEPTYGYPGAGSAFVGSSNGWVQDFVDLSGFGSTPRVRLVFSANASLASAGWYVSEVQLHDGDVTPPKIDPVVVPVDTEMFSGGYPVRVQVSDDVAVASVTLESSVNTAPIPLVPMVDLGGGLYEGWLPAQSHRSVVTWRAVASDGSQSGAWPELGTESFVVELRRPTTFVSLEPEGRVVGNEATFSWTAPQTVHAVDGYWINAVDLNGGRTVVERFWVDAGETEGRALLQPDGVRTFDLVAEYRDFGPSEPTSSVVVDLEAAALVSVDPDVVYQGDRVRVRLEGENLYLDAGDFVVFGARIVAEPLVVETVNDASVMIDVPVDAPTGPLPLTLVTQWGSYSFDDALTVLSGSDAPRIVEISPPGVRQGNAATVVIRASEPFAGPVVVDPGLDVLVVSDPVWDEASPDRVEVELVVAGDAAPGAHLLILDDGSRLWETDLVVQERVYTGKTGCGGCNGASNAPGFAPWLLLLTFLRRRC